MTSTATPRSANELIIFQKARRASGSTPEVGSSRKSTEGSCITAAPKATRCFQPPGSEAVSMCPLPSSPETASTQRFFSSRSSRGTP